MKKAIECEPTNHDFHVVGGNYFPGALKNVPAYIPLKLYCQKCGKIVPIK